MLLLKRIQLFACLFCASLKLTLQHPQLFIQLCDEMPGLGAKSHLKMMIFINYQGLPCCLALDSDFC
jgi:hypothetical protein